MKQFIRTLCAAFILLVILIISVSAYAETDNELRESNEIEIFVMEEDGSWWSAIYPADEPVVWGNNFYLLDDPVYIKYNKYWYEAIEGVEASGIRVEKVGEFRYQLMPETQEQYNMLCGYEVVDDPFSPTGVRQTSNLEKFLNEVESPSAEERKKAETIERSKNERTGTAISGQVINSYIYDNDSNSFNVVDYSDKKITVSTYKKR